VKAQYSNLVPCTEVDALAETIKAACKCTFLVEGYLILRDNAILEGIVASFVPSLRRFATRFSWVWKDVSAVSSITL
jgi:hypothetical protein